MCRFAIRLWSVRLRLWLRIFCAASVPTFATALRPLLSIITPRPRSLPRIQDRSPDQPLVPGGYLPVGPGTNPYDESLPYPLSPLPPLRSPETLPSSRAPCSSKFIRRRQASCIAGESFPDSETTCS